MDSESLKSTVKQKYGEAALRAGSGGSACCGATSAAPSGCCDPITSNLYTGLQKDELPEAAVLASLGCGNPTALAELKPGDTVLDLGSGGGIDVLLSARRVGPQGKAYGLDMTDEMLALAEANRRVAGVENAEFLRGEIENIPLPDNSVDVIISNCVINLSADKDRVLAEAFRVLKPGGHFAVSDVVTEGDIPARVRANLLSWIGCVAGALERDEYRDKLARAGFEHIGIEPTRVYRAEDAREFLTAQGLDAEKLAAEVDGRIFSAFVRASKPASRRVRRRVLVLCTGNSARSQMAEGLMRQAAAGRFEVVSAGTHPSHVRPEAIAVMREIGIDISRQRSKSVAEFDGQDFDYVVTVCDNARESCPVFPGARAIHWPLDDPAAASGPEPERLAAFRAARDAILARMPKFVETVAGAEFAAHEAAPL